MITLRTHELDYDIDGFFAGKYLAASSLLGAIGRFGTSFRDRDVRASYDTELTAAEARMRASLDYRETDFQGVDVYSLSGPLADRLGFFNEGQSNFTLWRVTVRGEAPSIILVYTEFYGAAEDDDDDERQDDDGLSRFVEMHYVLSGPASAMDSAAYNYVLRGLSDGYADSEALVEGRNAHPVFGPGKPFVLADTGASLRADLLTADGGGDVLAGLSGDDTIDGGAGDDLLAGNRGDDSIMGGGGDDRLRGGTGDDTVQGGAGDDTMRGGSGADAFVFGAGDGTDTIRDFDATEGDRLILSAALADGAADGAAVVARFGAVEDGVTVLRFGAGDVIRFDGIAETATLAASIEIGA